MAKVLVVFYSRSGVTETLAKAVAEGATGEGAEVRMRRAREVVGREVMQQAEGWAEAADEMNARYEAPTPADADWADAIVFGTPTRFGTISSELKAYLDSLGGLWFQGKLANKVGSAFNSTSTPHGGNENTSLALYVPMMHFGMIVVPPGYADPIMMRAGSPYGATCVGKATDDELEVARFQGRRVTQIAKSLKGG